MKGHSYNPQNVHNARIKGTVYAVNGEGHIVKQLSPEEVKPYLKKKREIDGVAALRKMGAEEEKIQQFIERMRELKFKYTNFESDSILWIAASVNGEKLVYINDKLSRAVEGIDIAPEDFRSIARERYQIDLNNLQEMRCGRKLNEERIKKIIREVLIKCINENNDIMDKHVKLGMKGDAAYGCTSGKHYSYDGRKHATYDHKSEEEARANAEKIKKAHDDEDRKSEKEFDRINSLDESHGNKKHNGPKDKFAAMRKGNRDAERDMFGDGFKAKDRIHNAKGYDRREGKRVQYAYDEMDENVVRLNGEDIRNMIKENLKEVFNGLGRDPNYTRDGKYRYQGTGSEESDERSAEIRRRGWQSQSDDEFNKDHGESRYEKYRKESGGIDNAPSDDSGDLWHTFIMELRNMASRNGYFSYPGMLDKFMERLKEKDGAKSFIEYLYKNGFKDMHI